MTKPTLKEAITTSFNTIAQELASVDEKEFFAPIGDKWSIAENILHLTQSAKTLNVGLALPQSVLVEQFGKIDRPQMSYDEVVASYLAILGTGLKARGAFIPELPENPSKAVLMSSFVKHHEALVHFLDTFTETELDELCIKHPVLKLLTIREIYYFMHYHIGHHHKAIKAGFSNV
ncbi:DinB family protein [Emticicia fluvialis]|uniref:DinB family protein n=1 Tax=Emticicia fluvialis TaxID=2974474 RepID=UPI00216512EF|nr:DinB family protein [Emticicia fluvialis]